MRHNPLFSVVQSPQFGTGQEEQSPVDVPLVFLAFAVGLRQNGFQFAASPAIVEVLQPSVRCSFVMGPIDTPVLRDGKVLGKVQQQVIAGHGPTGEEILRHPTLVEVVGVVLVREDVHEEGTTGFQESFDLGQ